MNRLFKSLVVVFIVATCNARAATAISTGGRIELAIDGAAAGRISSFEGGDPRASVVVINSGDGSLPKKSIGTVSYAPITVDVIFPLAPALVTWIGDFCANNQKRHTVQFTPYTVTGTPAINALEALNTSLTEVRFPTFDASSREAAHLTLIFKPESTRVPTGTIPTSAVTSTKAAALSNFRIQVAGLDASRVNAIEAFTITQPTGTLKSGDPRDAIVSSGPPVFSNLILTISSSDIAGWNTWRDNFVVKGMAADSDEKNGSFSILASDMTTSLFALQFFHVGILRASPSKIESGSEAISRFQAELYYESVTVGTSAPGLAGPPSPTPAPGGASKKGGASAAGDAKAGSSAASEKSGSAESAKDGVTDGTDKKGESDPVAKSGGSEKADAAGETKGGSAGEADKKGASAADSKGGSDSGVSAKSEVASTGGSSKAETTSGTDKKGGELDAKSNGSSEKADSTITSATDQGGRDPANFPRPAGTVRKSYSSIRQKTSTQEIAVYSSKGTLDALEEQYTKTLTSTGWELTSRYENNFGIGARHQIVLNLKSGVRSVTVTLTDYKEAGSEISVNLTTAIALAK